MEITSDFWIGCLVILGIIFLFYKSMRDTEQMEKFENQNITFMSQKDTDDFLQKDIDHYLSKFSIYDLQARGVKNTDEYLEKIKESVTDFTDQEKKRLRKLCLQIDQTMKSIQKPWFNGQKASHIPWVFGITYGDTYEGGLPHTRGKNVIMVSNKVLEKNNEDLKETLLHEKVHLYQKRNPEDMERYIQEKGMERWKRKEVGDRIRANPDTDDYIYKNKEGQVMKTVYKEELRNMDDVETYPENAQESEHPYEKMAIEIEKEI